MQTAIVAWTVHYVKGPGSLEQHSPKTRHRFVCMTLPWWELMPRATSVALLMILLAQWQYWDTACDLVLTNSLHSYCGRCSCRMLPGCHLDFIGSKTQFERAVLQIWTTCLVNMLDNGRWLGGDVDDGKFLWDWCSCDWLEHDRTIHHKRLGLSRSWGASYETGADLS